MSDVLKMDIDEIRNKASKIRGLKDKFKSEIVNGLSGLSNGLSDVWIGEACEAFQVSVEKKKDFFESVCEVLEGFATNLEIAAKDFENIDDKIAKKIRNAKD